MALYRVLNSIQVKDKEIILAGDFILSGDYKQTTLDKLEEVGAIGILHAPPLSELPGINAEQLATIGIISADQLLEAPADEIETKLSIDKKTIYQWKTDVSNWLIVPARADGG